MLEQYISINDEIKRKFDLLYELVLGSPVNVTAIRSKEEFLVKHILDSLYFFTKYPLKIKTVADIGSGGGFPGLALAVYFPEWHVTLVDSIGKKCRFLEAAAKELDLGNVCVINARAENMSASKFDLITARGVGSVKDLLKYTAHLVHDKGAWLMYKGERLAGELAEAGAVLGGKGIKSETIRIETPFTRSYLYLHY